jgi:hypothetical protein
VTTVKTVGGWDAVIIWRREVSPAYWRCIYAIHKPGTEDETPPIAHDPETGAPESAFSINEAPCFGAHPATLLLRRASRR